MHILLIESNKRRAQKLKKTLSQMYYETDIISTGESALTRLERVSPSYDIVIINTELPDMDAEDFCRQVRLNGITIPMIAISSSKDHLLAVRMLLNYVDDFVVLPVHSIELIARIYAVSRRPDAMVKPITQIGDLIIDNQQRIIKCNNQEIILSRKEFLIIEFLSRRAPEIITRAELSGYLWEIPEAASSNTLDAHIKNIRRKISKYMVYPIETVRGIGYRMKVK